MWINSTYFWNYECDALSAYVALCNKHNICIKWRTPDYCCKQTAMFYNPVWLYTAAVFSEELKIYFFLLLLELQSHSITALVNQGTSSQDVLF